MVHHTAKSVGGIAFYLISSYFSELGNGVVRKFTETFISSLSVEPFAV